MSYSPLLGNPVPQFEDSTGAPYVGMRLFVYLAGTTTKTNSYTDSTGGTANTNPVVLDASGYPTGGVGFYGDESIAYKVVAVAPGSDDPPATSLWTVDNLTRDQGYPITANETAAGVTPTDYDYPPGDAVRYGATGDGIADDTTALQTAINTNEPIITSSVPLYVTDTTQLMLVSDQRFHNIEFVSTASSANDGYCFYGNTVSNVSFFNCIFTLKNRHRAAYFYDVTSNIKFSGCRFVSDSASGYAAYALLFGDAAAAVSDITVTDCYFENTCGAASVAVRVTSRVLISNNIFRAPLTGFSYPYYPTQVDIAAGNDGVVSNNIMDIPTCETGASYFAYGVYQGDAKFDRLNISDNVIKGLGVNGSSIGIKVGGGANSEDVVVSNNEVNTSIYLGIYCINTDKLTISGNYVDDATTSALQMDQTVDTHITGNNFRTASSSSGNVVMIGDGADYSVTVGMCVIEGNYIKKENTGTSRACIAFRTYKPQTILKSNILNSVDGVYIRAYDAGVNITQDNASTYTTVLDSDSANTRLNNSVAVDPLTSTKIGRETTYTTGATNLFAVTSTGTTLIENRSVQASANTKYGGLNFTNSSSGISGRRPTFIDALTGSDSGKGRLRIGAVNASDADIYVEMNYNGRFIPGDDGAMLLGDGTHRWSTVYATTGTINTSDENEKLNIEPIPQAWLDAWATVEYCRFKFVDAVAKKGNGARWHTGVIAQRVMAAFQAQGIDPFEIGLLCYDEWPDQYEEEFALQEVTLSDGTTEMQKVPTGGMVLVTPAGSRYGVRYEEALILECAYLRSKIPV